MFSIFNVSLKVIVLLDMIQKFPIVLDLHDFCSVAYYLLFLYNIERFSDYAQVLCCASLITVWPAFVLHEIMWRIVILCSHKKIIFGKQSFSSAELCKSFTILPPLNTIENVSTSTDTSYDRFKAYCILLYILICKVSE